MKQRSPKTTIRTCVTLILACLLLPPAGASASGPAGQLPVTLGSRVRILAPSVVDGRLEGFLMGIEDEFLLVGVQESAPLRVRRDAITQLEVSTGKDRRVLKGTLIGAVVGAGILAAAGSEAYCYETPSCEEVPAGERAVIGALGGALWGAGIGALIKRERWGKVPLDGVRLSAAPLPGKGVQVALSIAF